MMRSLGLILFSMAGCTSVTSEGGLLVTLELDPGLSSKCVQLVARVGSTERRSGAIALMGGTTTSARVAVAQGDFPDQITVQAFGFSDDACRVLTTPPESSVASEVRFVKNVATTPVVLRVRRELTAGEDCGNGLDDDDDSLTDCADPDCDMKACSAGNACLVEQFCEGKVCTGGTLKKCTMPPTACFAATGSCEAPAGECRYAPRVDATCDDSDPCTSTDRCDTTGQCRGTARACNSPPSQCFASGGTCALDGGCSYTMTEGASCNDGTSCTINDRCGADAGCSGLQVLCPKQECQVFANDCEADGGCRYQPVDAGVACQTGTCNATGNCIEPFPYAPSNFDEDQVPRVPTIDTLINCGETIIDTSTVPPVVTNWCATGTPEFGSASIAQAGEQPLLLITFKSLTVGTMGSLVFKGSRAPVLVVLGDASLLGPVRTEAGARTCASGAGGTGDTTLSENGGGGGAGYGSPGGKGGKSGSAGGGSGGNTNGAPELMPLRGGCSGGAGGDNVLALARGGGALQLSVFGKLTVSSVVTAPGRGGVGGPGNVLKAIAGNGGGSGGAILLEARAIELTSSASVTANGGGGGEGGDVVNGTGNAGSAGTSTLTPAAGGTGGSLTGAGGSGATRTSAAGDGNDTCGAGGGGLGRIRFNAVEGCTISGTALLSPTPTSASGGAGCP